MDWFRFLLLFLIFFSAILACYIPIAMTSKKLWFSSKKYIFYGISFWVTVVFFVGLLNSFVI